MRNATEVGGSKLHDILNRRVGDDVEVKMEARRPDGFDRDGGRGFEPSMMEDVGSLRSILRRMRRRIQNVATSDAPAQARGVTSSVLGNLIASGEGGYGSFNRGRAGDSPGETIDFSRLSLREIMRRQSLPRNDRNRLFAVGRFQVIPSTMRGAVNALNLDLDQTFTPELQERVFADYLIDGKRPQIKRYITGASRDRSAAQLALAREFASVADPRTGRSYYDGIGGNSASITAAQSGSALDQMRQQYAANLARGMSPMQAYDALRGVRSGDGPDPSQMPPAGLEKGDRGQGVRKLQDCLVQLGLMTQAEVDTGPGVFGPRTEAAVQRLQRATGREVDGIFGSRSRMALMHLMDGVRRGPDADPAITRVLQRQLVAAGHMTSAQVATGPGIFGPKTEAGLKAFQRANGLADTGILNGATFAALQKAAPPPARWPLPGHFTVNRADKPGEGDGEFGAPRSGGRLHQGIDIVAPVGSRVEAFDAGRVVLAGSVSGFGNTVVVQHEGGLQTVYAHLGRIDVSVGQDVGPNARLGSVGRTGNVPRAGDAHLHFEIREGATPTPLSGRAVNPRRYLDFPA